MYLKVEIGNRAFEFDKVDIYKALQEGEKVTIKGDYDTFRFFFPDFSLTGDPGKDEKIEAEINQGWKEFFFSFHPERIDPYPAGVCYIYTRDRDEENWQEDVYEDVELY